MCQKQCDRSRRCTWNGESCVTAEGYPPELRNPHTGACWRQKEILLSGVDLYDGFPSGVSDFEESCYLAGLDLYNTEYSAPFMCNDAENNLLNKPEYYLFPPTGFAIGDHLKSWIAMEYYVPGVSNLLAMNQEEALRKRIAQYPVKGPYMTGCKADGTTDLENNCGNFTQTTGFSTATNMRRLWNWFSSGDKMSCGGRFKFMCGHIVLHRDEYEY
jgi:hypothetical protein